MLWIRFDEQDRRTSAPHFCLTSIQGELVCLQDLYEENNLVLVFTHGLSCQECRSTTQSFIEREMEYQEQGSKTLFIFPYDVSETINQNGNDYFLSELPEGLRACMLLDPDKRIRRLYTGLMEASLVREEDTIVFVLDAYGAPYTAVIAHELSTHEVHPEILSWLQYINIQCPE